MPLESALSEGCSNSVGIDVVTELPSQSIAYEFDLNDGAFVVRHLQAALEQEHGGVFVVLSRG